ncbi:trans-aconitate methyltransferase [Litchfieldella qijiaojingensis]|uniref:Trans-aconitate methyltransferase n=1 Tax=Litchfieldella qijiaojingensis TaxID=980347 RepID=A0ABQ2YQN1_9GAMM|nr:class I SAM-dependent methyltransferase [Halomonas qijiaojingensis]GGX92126.1 trans-aconitate methyltransferase [Halomonas qijiaojingensis]
MNVSALGSRFDFDWLALRERADDRARSRRLTRLAADWLSRSEAPLVLVDLGSGAGNNPRFLAPRLPGPQHWRLVDHDHDLLVQAAHRCRTLCDREGRAISVETQAYDLADLDASWWEGAYLVCASALFDLVSRDWTARFAAACVRRSIAVLLTLSVDGRWAFVDEQGSFFDDEEDAWVNALFNSHQRRDKGLGAALGGTAPTVLCDVFVEHGYAVETASSPWQLPAGEPDTLALAGALVDGWFDAASEQAPAAHARLASWHARRRTALARGELGVWVGHGDVFASPSNH